MTTRRKVVLGVVVAGMLALLGLRIRDALRDVAAPVEVDLAFTAEPEQPLPDAAHLVADPRAGHRPRRDFEQELTVAPLGAPERTTTVVRRTSQQGLVRADDLGASVPGPRVLVLGDDQTMGAVATQGGWPARLEADLRGRGERFATATVLNAACDGYGLFHHVLRGPELIARYRPEVVVVAVATGDDVAALDDRSLPHVEDAGFPARPDDALGPDPLALGARADGLCPDRRDLALRGLAQAAWRDTLSDERAAVLERKTRQTLRWLLEMAPRGRLLVVLIPPADLARPDAVAAVCAPFAAEVIASGAQQRAHDAFLELCREVGVAHVDTLPALRAADGADVYRADGRLGTAGHAAVHAAVADRVERLATLR